MGYGALVLPWHSSPRHELDQSALHAATHGALALIEEVDESPAFPTPRQLDARRSILLAEDDLRLARVVQSALELEGEAQWSVTVANDGARALELAAASPPQVVLLDVFLPGVDGVEVYKRLRADPATRAARVIFVSAATSLDLYQRGIQDGVLLRKPFDVCDLVGLVRALLTA
jgi:CheY-like chemotaxis protein